MNNIKSTIFKRGTQISIYTLVQYFECAYYITLLYVCYNRGMFKCEITFSPYLSASLKHEVLRLKESEDEQ